MGANIVFPVKVDNFVFNTTGFSFKGREFSYSDIDSLKFYVIRESINFSKNEIYSFALRTADDAIYSASIGDAAFSFNQKKVKEKKRNLLAIYNHINKATFERRLNRYLGQLHKNGYCIYKFFDEKIIGPKTRVVKICANGDVILDGRAANLKISRDAGTLKFGTAYGLGYDRTINPYEISINEKKPLLGRFAEGSGSIRIDGSWDHPMIFEILKSLL